MLRFSVILVLIFQVSIVLSQGNGTSPILIELFTSQGCSSCPPSDKLLSKLKKNREIIALSFHVSYWNGLGWLDPFSQQEFSERQQHYGQHFGLSSIYTPQLIINGQAECVGSDEKIVNQLLEKAKKNNINLFKKVALQKSGSNSLKINYELLSVPKDATLNFVIISDSETTKVKRGENAGRTLVNENIVLHLQTLSATIKGEILINLPQKQNLSLVTFVQNKNFEIISVAKYDIK